MSLSLRPARASDLDAMIAVGIAAFPFIPQWVYQYPYCKENPEEHIQSVRKVLEEGMKRTIAGISSIMLVEASHPEDSSILSVVAFSIWNARRASNDKKRALNSSFPNL